MPRWTSSARPPAPRDARSPLDARSARRATLPLLVGYLAFGQYWGVWVILVFDFQRFHDLTESRLGALYTMLSITAVVVMLLHRPAAAATAPHRHDAARRSSCSPSARS